MAHCSTLMGQLLQLRPRQVLEPLVDSHAWQGPNHGGARPGARGDPERQRPLRSVGQDGGKGHPQLRLVEIPEVGHIPHLEAPEQFHQVVIDFLGK